MLSWPLDLTVVQPQGHWEARAEQGKECWPLSPLNLRAQSLPLLAFPGSTVTACTSPSRRCHASPHRKGTNPTPAFWKAQAPPCMALTPLCPCSLSPVHTKDSFRNWLPGFELFNEAFFFSLSSAAQIPDPAVAKIKDFLPQLSFH